MGNHDEFSVINRQVSYTQIEYLWHRNAEHHWHIIDASYRVVYMTFIEKNVAAIDINGSDINGSDKWQ